jgi:hypothetical protein
MKLKNNRYANDKAPLDEDCGCLTCQRFTRSYLHHTIKAQGVAAPAVLISYHNVAYTQVGRGTAGGLLACAVPRACRLACALVEPAVLPLVLPTPPRCPLRCTRTWSGWLSVQRLTRRIRAAIKEHRLPEFVRSYLACMFPDQDVPQWVVDALHFAGISLEGVANLQPAHDFYEAVPSILRIPLQ